VVYSIITAEYVGDWKLAKFHLAAVQRLEMPVLSQRRKVNGHTCVVWLHALQGMDKHGPALEIYFPVLRDDATLNFTSWPERMPHRPPGVLGVGAEIALTVFAGLEAWCFPGHLQMYNAGFVGC